MRLTRSVLLLAVACFCFVIAAIVAAGHAFLIPALSWAFAGAAAYIASSIP